MGHGTDYPKNRGQAAQPGLGTDRVIACEIVGILQPLCAARLGGSSSAGRWAAITARRYYRSVGW